MDMLLEAPLRPALKSCCKTCSTTLWGVSHSQSVVRAHASLLRCNPLPFWAAVTAGLIRTLNALGLLTATNTEYEHAAFPISHLAYTHERDARQ